MGKIKSGLLGGFSGKVGPVVGYNAMGQDLMRAKPKPRTSPAVGKELANRDKFKTAHLWLKPLLNFLRIGFQDYAPTYAGFVAAKSHLLNHAFTGKTPNQILDPALVLVSHGSLESAEDSSVIIQSSKKIVLKWSGGEYDYDDRCMYVIYAPTLQKAVVETAGPKRHFGKSTVRIPKYLAGHQVFIYLAFTRDDRKDRSKSQFLGEYTIPVTEL